VTYTPSLEDKFYVQGMMDGIGLLLLEGIIRKEDAERSRLVIASIPHTHYESVMGPYCVVCHIGKQVPTYQEWADGQEAV